MTGAAHDDSPWYRARRTGGAYHVGVPATLN